MRSRAHAETFHPVVGPTVEAEVLHVQQQRLVERAASTRGTFVIWDVGLGGAANAVAVLDAFRAAPETAPVELHSFDHSDEPLVFAIEHASELGYLTPYVKSVRELLSTCRVQVGQLCWQLHRGDFRELVRCVPAPPPHAVLYDPYSARANPGMWTLPHFRELRARLSAEAPCLLTNYTRSTAVRVTLLLAGFYVGRGVATGEKAETTIAANELELLRDPLPREWLKRVRHSTASAPLGSGSPGGAITSEDLATLEEHPQFSASTADSARTE